MQRCNSMCCCWPFAIAAALLVCCPLSAAAYPAAAAAANTASQPPRSARAPPARTHTVTCDLAGSLANLSYSSSLRSGCCLMGWQNAGNCRTRGVVSWLCWAVCCKPHTRAPLLLLARCCPSRTWAAKLRPAWACVAANRYRGSVSGRPPHHRGPVPATTWPARVGAGQLCDGGARRPPAARLLQ